MRVLFLTQWFDPEPGAIRGLPLAKSLIRLGDQVEVLTGFPNYPGGKVYPGYKVRPWQRHEIEGVPIIRVPLYPSHDGSVAGRILNYGSFAVSAATLGTALTNAADVAYVYHPPPTVGLPAMVLRAVRGVPCVYHIADMWPESVIESGMIRNDLARDVANSLLSSWCKAVYKQMAQITVLSPGFKRLLVERGVPAEKIHIVYNWTDEETFRPMPRESKLSSELGLTDTFNIVYAGNVGAFQGVDTIVRAAANLNDLGHVRVVIVGTGQRLDEAKKVAGEAGARNVVFLGRREYWEMADVYGFADVLVIHLNDHQFFAATIPSKTQVSLASGRPILMAVRGDAADIVRRADAGVTCAPQSPDAMTTAMRDFAQMPRDRLKQMGANGRSYYLQEMSLAKGVSRMREIFGSVVKHRPASGDARV
ncbi:MAG: glycosyltransferase family 4 protein [Bryobacterales bacterium]|nr:glycosyltransferase family 4 protein [Bryobacterales bacterium]